MERGQRLAETAAQLWTGPETELASEEDPENAELTCGEIVSMRGVTPATVSHHLKILSEARLIACRREGQFVYSEAVPETIAAYTRALVKMAHRKKTTLRR